MPNGGMPNHCYALEYNCPHTYAYAYDETISLYTCDSTLNADFTVTFCPYVSHAQLSSSYPLTRHQRKWSRISVQRSQPKQSVSHGSTLGQVLTMSQQVRQQLLPRVRALLHHHRLPRSYLINSPANASLILSLTWTFQGICNTLCRSYQCIGKI